MALGMGLSLTQKVVFPQDVKTLPQDFIFGTAIQSNFTFVEVVYD